MEIVGMYPVTNTVNSLLYNFQIAGAINYSVQQHIVSKQVDGVAITLGCLNKVINVHQEQ